MMMKHRVAVFVMTLALLAALTAPAQAKRELIQDEQGQEILAYENSLALIMGISRYRHWPGLPGVEDDIADVRQVLEEQGFQVEVAHNPTDAAAMQQVFDDFITRYGRAEHHRLLVYFAGHGETLPQRYGGDMGYIVGADAPLPRKNADGFLKNEPEFLTYALDMEMIEVYNSVFDKRQRLCWPIDKRSSESAWLVYFLNGDVYWSDTRSYSARCVRSGH